MISGTNGASLALAESLGRELAIPIVGINPALLWFALQMRWRLLAAEEVEVAG